MQSAGGVRAMRRVGGRAAAAGSESATNGCDGRLVRDDGQQFDVIGPADPAQADGADLELGHLGQRVERRIGQRVGVGRAAPVERHEQHLRPDRVAELGTENRCAPAGPQLHQVAGARCPSRRARSGWICTCGSGTMVPPSRRVWVPLWYWRHQPAGGQHVRVLRVRGLGRRLVQHPMESGPAVRGRETLGEHPRRAGVLDVGARPEDTLLRVDPLVGDAGVVGDAAGAGPPQLVEDDPRIVREVLAPAEFRRPAWTSICRSSSTPTGGGRACLRRITRPSTLVMVPSSSAHCAVGSTTSAMAAVSDRKMSETTSRSSAPSRSADPVGVRRGDHDVGRQHQQRPNAAVGAHPVEHLECRLPRQRKLFRVDAPDLGDVLAGLRVVQPPVPGQLIGLLAVLAAALAVALAGDGAVAGRLLARAARGRARG